MTVIGQLPRREREIFELLCGEDDLSAAQVRERMVAPPSYSAVRTLLGRLEAKGLVNHSVDSQTYRYRCARRGQQVRASALRHLVRTFFEGSAVGAATALLGISGKLTDEEIDALQRTIDVAKARRK